MEQPRVILATVNARYSHCSLGLRSLLANMGPLREATVLREFQLGQRPTDIAEKLLACNPSIIGLGVYIWNVDILEQTAQILKNVRPDVTLVLGGPEVSHEPGHTRITDYADYVIAGEGELLFASLARDILRGNAPARGVLGPEPPQLDTLQLPYAAYSEEDIRQRTLYVEASRGCPFRCAFCLSALDRKVREFPLAPFLEEMTVLIERGARSFRFVDRTFNLRQERVDSILGFFLEHWREGMRLHFEIVPDRLSEETLHLFRRFPAEGLHLEAGVQTFTPSALEAIDRRQDNPRVRESLAWLRDNTGAIVHADLIAGLPEETLEAFAASFDQLLASGSGEIQVGVLKRLPGAPIAARSAALGLIFAVHAPYEVLQTPTMDFETLQRIKRFARYFDLYHNNGNFPESLPLLWRVSPSPFQAFMALSGYIWKATGKTSQLSLVDLTRRLYEFLMEQGAASPEEASETLTRDFRRLAGRADRLEFLEKSSAG